LTVQQNNTRYDYLHLLGSRSGRGRSHYSHLQGVGQEGEEERQGRVRNALSGRRESSGGEESVRDAGGSPQKVRSPWEMKRGVFWRGVLLQEALVGVHRRCGVCQGSGGGALGGGVFRVAELESSGEESVRDAEESTGGRGVPGKEEESPEGSTSGSSLRHGEDDW